MCQTLDTMILDVKDKVAGDVHVQLRIDNGYLTLGIPVAQLPEKLAVNGVLDIYHSTLFHIGNSELHQIVLFVNIPSYDVLFL